MDNVPSQVLLRVKDMEFSCSRKLLSDSSRYFHAMFNNDFKEKHQESVSLQEVEPEALDFIINALSETVVDFTKSENILDVLEATSMLQFEHLQKECIKYIASSWLDKDTWLPTANLADKLDLTELKRKTKPLALWYFSDVRKTEQFLYLSPEEILEYLNDDKLRTTEGEFEVFEAGVNWIECSPDDRLFYSLPLLKAVRFKEMESFDIRNMLHFSSVKDTPQAELIVECILEIKDGVLNQSCESCNAPVIDDQDSVDSGKSSPLPTGVFFKNLKRKRRTTSHCTCFDSATVKTAQELLDKDIRCLPLIPCVVASFPFSTNTPDSPRLRLREKNKWPYLFQWDGIQLLPFIHLSKIDEGPAEAMGYKVLIKDMKLYVIGGEYMMGKGDWNTSVWFYDTLREVWQFETSLPSPRRHHSALCVNDDLYVIGGVGRHRVMLDSVAKYNLVTKTWESCAPLPTPMYSPACCVYQEDIYLFESQLYCYRQAVGSWEVMSNFALPDKIAVAAAVTDGSTIYVIGRNGRLYSFVPHSEEIEVEVLGQFKIAASNACLVNKSIFSFGEEDDIQSVEEYNIGRKTFTMLKYRPRDEPREDESYCLNHQSAGCFALPKYF